MGKKIEKILILTLGTGALAEEKETAEKLEDVINKGIAAYRAADYCFDGEKKQEIIKSEFIAYPLIKTFQPDKIVILGTIKSSWAAFYAKFSDVKKESVRALCRMECNGGKDTSKEELLEYAKTITQIYQRELNQEPFVSGTKIEVILTRYGICENELLENYELLNQIGASLKKDVKYEIAFDITHSFRSLPIYNLVILNYFKAVSDFDIQIKHIFYGNLEVCRENHNIAQIVDLADLVEVMELTNGVSEFRNTGNATTLLRIIPEEEKELKIVLEKFDWATQGNAFDKIDKALKELVEIVSQSSENKSRYADLRNMIYQVILTKYFQQNGVSVKTIEDMKTLSVAEKQFATCKWYLNQNRYGQALATGLEALRSMLVPLYLEMKNIEETQENCDNENYRKSAIDRLRVIKQEADSQTSSLNEVQNMFCELEQCRMCAVPIRNVFAHNLKENVTCLCETCKGNNANEEGYYCSKKITETFITRLERLYVGLKKNYEHVKTVYQKEYSSKKPTSISQNNENVRVVISNEVLNDYEKWKKTANKKIYKVYRLDEKIVSILNLKNLMNSTIFLGRYLQNFIPKNKKLNVILEGLSLRQMMHFIPMLHYIGCNVEVDGKVIGKLGYSIDWEILERIELGEGLEKLLSEKLVQC